MRRSQNLKKNLPSVLTKQLFLLSSVKTSGRFFQILWPFQKSWTSIEIAHSKTYIQWICWYQFIMTAPMKSNEFVLKKLQFFLHDFHSIKCQCHAKLFISNRFDLKAANHRITPSPWITWFPLMRFSLARFFLSVDK